MFAWKPIQDEPKEEARIICIGLDGAGKTTIISYYKTGKYVEMSPTHGMSLEKIKFRDLEIISMDMGGQIAYRQIWDQFFPGTALIVFVVDAADRMRVAEAKEELDRCLESPHLVDKPLLVFANKQDLKDTMSQSEIIEKFNLNVLTDRSWTVIECSALVGTGLAKGFQWIFEQITGQELDYEISIHEIYVFDEGGISLAHVGKQKKRLESNLVTAILSAFRSLGQRVFEENVDIIETEDYKLVLGSKGSKVGMIIIEPQDDEEVAKQTLDTILSRLEKLKPGTTAQDVIDEIIAMRY
ncbi:MAG: ADP-ribosylation factor family protein [Promethearchaeota archaeon]